MGYLLAQEWAALMLSLALAAVRKFMVTELQWLTLHNMCVCVLCVCVCIKTCAAVVKDVTKVRQKNSTDKYIHML